ncbi:SDR family oxidoreductase [Ochrobactrum sp. Q0168]|uniref:SDR family NAD(P)-dependent oxidoreductase n=1 Tax=Ochrobactrum sp. Q0168 TaxID=2793241 RepID=UPI0018EDB6AB|nr:SDR family oxidoreductase [Ochrobactrum sp. Q0168]
MQNEVIRDYLLTGKTALVTGAAGGIGHAIAERLLGLGASVVMSDADDRVFEAAERLLAQNHNVSAVKLDITDSRAVGEVADHLNDGEKSVDILIANAGVGYGKAFLEHTDADWRRVMSVNLDGTFYCVREFGKHMVRRRLGAVVAISSIAGTKAVRPEVHAGYDTSKAAIAHLCRVTGVEWAPHNVRVNAVGPGYTETDMLKTVGVEQPETMKVWLEDTPTRRLLQPKEIAATVGFLASDAASGITGQLVMTDHGYSAY